MFKALRKWFPAAERPRLACVEGLERRALMAATVVTEHLVGPDPRNVEGVRITFSEPMDLASAQDLENYRVGRRTDRRQNYSADDPDRLRRNDEGLIRFASAVYDPATMSVTLTARDPFNIVRRFRNIRVLARPDKGVRDALGNLLDGDRDGTPGKDALERFTFRRAGKSSWGELDGDNVTLKLIGPGRVWVIRQSKGGRVLERGDARQVYIERADPARSVLTGKVSGFGNGVAVIDELVNTSTAQVQIASDPSFQIVRSVP